MASPAARTALTALLPLSMCWSEAASAQQTPAQPAPQIQPQSSQQQQQSPVVAGTIIPQVFDLPPQPFTLTPQPHYNVTDENQRVIGPQALPETPDNGWSIGPFVLREDPTPEAGCRWSLRGSKIRFRCRG